MEKQTIKWEVSVMQFKDSEGIKYKVTRRLPVYSVAETKIFSSKKEALEQVVQWSQ